MKKATLLAQVFFLACLGNGYAQSPSADFTLPGAACREQNVVLVNTSTDANQYQWDFCLKDSETLISNVDLATVTGLSGGYGYKLVEDNGQWFGFVASENNHTIYRLDFGSSPTNTPTSVTSLGNPGGALQFPEGIDIAENNGSWFAFIGSFNTNHGVVRLDFGSSLTNNSPVAQNLGNFGFSTRFRNLKLYKENSDNILILAGYNPNSIIRINYRDSFNNTISAGHIFNSGTITGLVNPLGMDVVTDGDGDLIMLVASYNGNSITQLNFGASILSVPVAEATYGLTGISRPYYVRFIQEGSQFYAAISNESVSFKIFNFFDLDIAQPPIAVSHAALPVVGGLEAFRLNGKTYIQGSGTSNNKLKQLLFEASCDASLSSFAGENPPSLQYTQTGVKEIELRALNSASGERSSNSHSITISNFVAPDIAFTSLNICEAHDVNFTSSNSSGDITTYDWDFDDGSPHASIDNPTHQFILAGVYKITLGVTASNGCQNTTVENLEIYPQPDASFDLPSGLLCTNNDFTFTNTIPDNFDGNLTYRWYVDDEEVSTNLHLIYSFTTTGVKEIKLQASIPGCSDEITQSTSAVQTGPVVDFSFSGKCEDETVEFTSDIVESVTSYSWDFFDGTSSTEENPDHIFTNIGTYAVTLTALSPSGCNNSKTKAVPIHTKPSVDFKIFPPPLSCSGADTYFADLTIDPSDSDIQFWQWNFDDAGPDNTSTLKDPTHVFANAGNYNVSLTTTTDLGCSSTWEEEITISQSPEAVITNTPTCLGAPVDFNAAGNNIETYYWEIGTVYYEVPNPTHIFNVTGDRSVKLTIVGHNDCETVYNKIVTVPVVLSPDFSFTSNCAGFNTVFTDLTTGVDPVVEEVWDFAGQGTAGGASPSFEFATTGDKLVTLSVITEAGCSYTKNKNVTIVSPPVAGFTVSPESGAAPLEVQFTNTSAEATTYHWLFQDGTGASSDQASPVYTFNELGEFQVDLTASNAEGCTDLFSGNINIVAPLPDVDLKLITVSENMDGTLKVIITVHNKGNTILRNLPVVIDISGSVLLTETITDPIAPSAQYNLVLDYGLNQSVNLDFLCAQTALENDPTPEGNRICKEFESGVFLFNAYPNPAQEEVRVEWIAPEDQVVNISLTDSFGKNVLLANVGSVKGLNSFLLKLSNLRSGIYMLRMKAGSALKTQRILVSGQN